MTLSFNPRENYEKTRDEAGYVSRKDATQEDYDRIGFMSGLEVHQQLKTKEKLFCHCPAGVYQKPDVYDAEVIRHMRPTLSELGEYDGTALMEFKTRKNIVYRLKNETTCTYEVDDTPPFPVNREALQIAIEISLLSKLNIVGEVHITRKQYLDGSIPTGFQRTAIIGVEGLLPLPRKNIRLIQLSLEEDSCREVSDIGHTRIYRTDRLGMPLIETVTYPEMVNPDEVKEVCDYIRFLNRSTGKVRTGIGAGRQDVNVSCRGGHRVEIKGVAHTRWIPELTHVEAFRQWSLLLLRDKLINRIPNHASWKINHVSLDYHDFKFQYAPLAETKNNKFEIIAVNLPGFKSALSHFTQPGKMFANEISDRLKVIACLEVPNLIHSEEFEQVISEKDFETIKSKLNAGANDAQIIIWGSSEDMPTALETIEERCLMAFKGIPGETRKSFENGTTIFERVLPGADRMYPDTDSAPIPLEDSYIDQLSKTLPQEVIDRYHILKTWGAPEDTYTYIFKKDLFPLIEKITNELQLNPVFVTALFGHKLKHIEGQIKPVAEFNYKIVYALLKFLKEQNLQPELAWKMLPVVYEHPKMDFQSVLESIKFKRIKTDDILAKVPFLRSKYAEIRNSDDAANEKEWIMGQLRQMSIGNINLRELSKLI
ncbi:MAG TPA: Glu-tRNA(Gln) amidotransferase subunit GatE [Lentimicrobium sp.]|nr:Glu-tRNA(Gln) amidotransferase subunit GatE [Lentimicrobium sp.]